MRIDRERLPVQLELRVSETLQGTISRSALKNALSDAPIDGIRVTPVRTHCQVPLPRPDPQDKRFQRHLSVDRGVCR